MTVFEIMQACRRGGDDCQSIQESINMRREAVTSITGRYGEGGGHGSGESDKLAAYAARVDSLLARLNLRKKRWAFEMEVCLDEAERRDGIERTILYSYYARAWTLDAIAQSAGFTAAYVRKKKAAIDEELRNRNMEVPDWYTEANNDGYDAAP